MPRWQPDAQLRLIRAAVELFTEQGYASTTVAEIAERAGLTKTTFFRHFPDKREVLFAGQESHARLLTEAIATAPADAAPLDMVEAGLVAVADSFTPEQRQFGSRLQQAVADTDELRERSSFKHIGLVIAVTGALRDRQVPEPAALVAAELGVHALDRAYARWIQPTNRHDFGDLAAQAMDELRTAAGALTTDGNVDR